MNPIQKLTFRNVNSLFSLCLLEQTLLSNPNINIVVALYQTGWKQNYPTRFSHSIDISVIIKAFTTEISSGFLYVYRSVCLIVQSRRCEYEKKIYFYLVFFFFLYLLRQFYVPGFLQESFKFFIIPRTCFYSWSTISTKNFSPTLELPLLLLPTSL